MNRLTKLAMLVGALSLPSCTSKEAEEEFRKSFDVETRVANFEYANGFDCDYRHDSNGHIFANNLRIGTFDSPNIETAGYDLDKGLIIATDKNRDGIFDSIRFIGVPEGHPLEELATRERLNDIGNKLLEYKQRQSDN